MPIEEYTLILKHEYIDGDLKIQIDEPYIMKMSVCHSVGNPAIELNQMLERFTHEILQREAQLK